MLISKRTTRAAMRGSVAAVLATLALGCGAQDAGSGSVPVAQLEQAQGPLSLSVLAGAVGQSGSSDGVGGAARLRTLYGVASDAQGKLSLIEPLAVRQVTPAGVVTTFSALPTYGSDPPDFPDPRGVAVDGSGAVYVSNNNVYTVDKIAANGTITTVAGTLYSQGGSLDLDHPEGIATDASNDLYIADTWKNRVLKRSASGSISVLATGFAFPRGVAVDRDGNVLVADTGNFVIRAIAPNGAVSTIAGSLGQQGHVDGAGSAARFTSPSAIAASQDGTLYVADATTIRKITSQGDVSTFVGVPGQASLSLGALPASLEAPSGVAVTPSGNLAISELAQNVVLTVAGASADCSGGQCDAHVLADFSACSNADLESTLATACEIRGGETPISAGAFGAYSEPTALDVGRAYNVSLPAFDGQNAGIVEFTAPHADDYLIYLGTPNVPFQSDSAPACSRYLSEARVQAITAESCPLFRGVYRISQVPQGAEVHIRLGKLAPQRWVRVLILPRNP